MVSRITARTLTPPSPEYPQLLLPLDDRPTRIFVVGNAVTSQEKCIAVIGTRKMTAYGRSATRSFVRDLALAGFTIISGLAFGVDAEAHRTAIEFNAKTIAILPSGLGIITPTEHTNLATTIVESGGALYSEYQNMQLALKHHFHIRNRIIAGMSMGVLVIEAGERSGTAITVAHAGRYGRPVFAVPGPFTSPFSEGTKAMVNMGAKLVTSVQDILEEFNMSTETRGVQQELLFESSVEKHVYESLEVNGASSLNTILQSTSLTIIELQTSLTSLEIRGLITQKFGEYILA